MQPHLDRRQFVRMGLLGTVGQRRRNGGAAAAQHYQDAANCYQSQTESEQCLKLAEQELTHEHANIHSQR
jgi:hypothetical protein